MNGDDLASNPASHNCEEDEGMWEDIGESCDETCMWEDVDEGCEDETCTGKGTDEAVEDCATAVTENSKSSSEEIIDNIIPLDITTKILFTSNTVALEDPSSVITETPLDLITALLEGETQCFHPVNENHPWQWWGVPVLKDKMNKYPDASRPMHKMSELMYNPFHVYHASKTPGFLDDLLNADSKVNSQCPNSANVFQIIGLSSLGRSLINVETVRKLAIAHLVNCSSSSDVIACFFFEMAISPIGCKTLLESNILPVLLRCLTQCPQKATKLYLFDCIHLIFIASPVEAVRLADPGLMLKFLESEDDDYIGKVSRLIMDTASLCEGKRVLVHLISPLTSLITKAYSDFTLSMLAGAVMMLATTSEGKLKCVSTQAISKIFPLMTHPYAELRLHVIKIMTLLAEVPEGREKLVPKLPDFYKRAKEKRHSIKKAARIAIKVIEWIPD